MATILPFRLLPRIKTMSNRTVSRALAELIKSIQDAQTLNQQQVRTVLCLGLFQLTKDLITERLRTS
jgi:hypothetical protein